MDFVVKIHYVAIFLANLRMEIVGQWCVLRIVLPYREEKPYSAVVIVSLHILLEGESFACARSICSRGG